MKESYLKSNCLAQIAVYSDLSRKKVRKFSIYTIRTLQIFKIFWKYSFFSYFQEGNYRVDFS